MRWVCVGVCWPQLSCGLGVSARTLHTGRLCLHKPVSHGQLRQCQELEVLWGSGWTIPLSFKINCAGIKRQGWAWSVLNLMRVNSVLRPPEKFRHSIPVSYHYWWLYRCSRSKPASSLHDFYPVFLHDLSNPSFIWQPIRYFKIAILS